MSYSCSNRVDAASGAAPRPRASGARWTKLFESPSVTITDLFCRPDATDCGGELCFGAHRISFLRAGRYRKHVSGEIVPGDVATAMFYSKNEAFRASHPDLGGDWDTFFDFGEHLLEEVSHAVGSKRKTFSFGRTHAIMCPAALLASRQIFQALKSVDPAPLRIEEESLRLLALLFATPAASSNSIASAPARHLALLARETVASCCCEEITLSDLSRTLGCSPFHLARTFRAIHGIPIHKYQTRLRLVAALDRLAGGEDNLSLLAHECGFSSHSHFTLAFRKAFGMSPSAMRRQASRSKKPRPFRE